MAGYVPWHGKKRSTLRRREGGPVRLLGDGAAPDAMLRAAGELRDARVRFLRSEASRIDGGDGTHATRLARLDAEARAWSAMTPEAVLEDARRGPIRARSEHSEGEKVP